MTIMWQSCGADALPLRESVGSALDLGADPKRCLVWETEGRELPGHLHLWLASSGVEVTSSAFRRGRGMPQALSVVRDARETLERKGGTHLLRLDSDTIVNNAQRINRAEAEDLPAMAWAWAGCPLAGCSYVMRKDTLDKALLAGEDSDIVAAYPFGIEDDATLSYLLERIGVVVKKHWFRPEGGYGKGWVYKSDDPDTYARIFDVITFGNRHLMGGKCGASKRERMALEMAKFRLAAKKVEDREMFSLPH